MGKLEGQRAQAEFLKKVRPSEVKRIVGKGKAFTYGRASDAAGANDLDFFRTDLSDPKFASFARDAYDSEAGYAIRINPNTGQKEMFIAGTRHTSQWGLNALDTVLYGADKMLDEAITLEKHAWTGATGIPLPPHKRMKLLSRLDMPREMKQLRFAKIAKANNVDVVYGHSRGAAMAADLDLPGVAKIGLDGAMVLANETDTLNLEEGHGWNPLGLFDEAIGFTGEQNVNFDLSTWKPHQVWKSGP